MSQASPAATPSDDTPDAASARAERDRFVALAFCWADTLIELDAELRIDYAAGLTMAVTGMSPEDLTGRAIDDVLAKEHGPELRRLLTVAGQCGRVDDVSISFAGPDGDAPVDLAIHVIPEFEGRSFLAMRLSGDAEAARTASPSAAGSGLLDEQALIEDARRHLPQRGDRPGKVLTLLAIPEMAGMRRSMDRRAYRNLSNTVCGYLKARSVDRRAADLGDGRYGVVHDRALDVEQLESHLLSVVRGAAEPETEVGIESASILANESLAEETLGQVILHAIRQFQRAEDTAAALRDLRDNLPTVAADAAELCATFAELVDSKGFHIAFQPVVACDGGDILFFEGLARIDGRDNESPYKYISYAQETGQICNFDLAMVEKAMAWIEDRSRSDLHISVNLSGLSLLDPDFISRLHQTLDSQPECARLLALEITECFRVPNLDAVDQLIQSLRQRVGLVGLDDVSADIDGFRMLDTLEIDFVKFQARASKAAADSVKTRAYLESLTGFCRKIDVRTVATAVETVECLTLLRGCGVDYVQGYLLGKPSADIASFR